MANPQERRRFSRIHLNAPVEVSQGKLVQQAHLLDISLKGMLLQPEQPPQFDAAQSVWALAQLTAEDCIAMEARMLPRPDGLLGLTCVSMDLDSISHLRRLLELNLADANAAERELSELIPLESPEPSAPQKPQDQRRNPRLALRGYARLGYSTRDWEAHLLDISVSGARLAVLDEHLLRPGDQVNLTFELDSQDTGGRRLQLQAEVVHLREHILGVNYAPVTAEDRELLEEYLAYKGLSLS